MGAAGVCTGATHANITSTAARTAPGTYGTAVSRNFTSVNPEQ